MRHVLAFLIAFLLLVSGCATTANYQVMINTWIGHDQNDLISSWGPPNQTYRMPNGNVMFTWLHERMKAEYSPGTGTLPDGTEYLTADQTGSTRIWCKTTFTTVGGRVTHARWEGNGCVR
jgi:hypothetical protein